MIEPIICVIDEIYTEPLPTVQKLLNVARRLLRLPALSPRLVIKMSVHDQPHLSLPAPRGE